MQLVSVRQHWLADGHCKQCGISWADIKRCVELGGPSTCLVQTTARRTRVYVAGPYSTGDSVINTRAAIDAGTALLKRGYAPFVPHLTMFWHLIDPQPYETWLNYDFEWVAACDVLLRLFGASSGAEREVSLMQALRRNVYYSLDSLCASEPATRVDNGPSQPTQAIPTAVSF